MKPSLRGGPQGRRGNLLVALGIASSLMLLAMTGTTAAAVDPQSDFILQMARVDLMLRKRQFVQAADELGKVPKEQQEDPLFQKYAEKVVAALYTPKARAAGAPGAAFAQQDRIIERLRITTHKRDANARSDRSFDNEGFQVNQHAEADVKGNDGIRAKFVMDVDGYKNGHRDVRYRTLLGDFYDGPSHFAIGDTATYTSPYFLRGSRLRGVNMILSGELNEFQALAGGYPVWLEDRDEYIYPRTVMGLRDRWKIFDDRIRLGANFVNTRDSAKVRTINTSNVTRDNFVYSLDQEIKLIQDTWYVKGAQAYSYTDEGLEESRFGENTKLKDTSFRFEQLLIQPWAKLTTRFERTGPDFRLLTDFPQGPVNFPKGITADRMITENYLDLKPLGPFDVDLQASFNRNDLARDSEIEHTRQAWYTANVGVLVPRGWPRPRVRATLVDTVSVPGTQVRPAQSRRFNVRSELSHYHEGINFTEFAQFETEYPSEDKTIFNAEERWSLGTRASTTFLERILVSPHYTYRFVDVSENTPIVDNQLTFPPADSVQHEAGVSTSTRLWSTSSLGLSYTYLHGDLRELNGNRLTSTQGHSGAVNFTWPYTKQSWNKRRKMSVFPALNAHITDLSDGLEKRIPISAQLNLAYEVLQHWKAELRGEVLFDKDQVDGQVRTEDHRIWMLWTAEWNENQTATAPWAWSTENESRRNVLEFGPEIYYSWYQEPDIGVEIQGAMYGLQGSFTHHNPSHLMLKGEARSAWGRTDYTGSGRIEDVADYMYEGRLLTGYDIPIKEETRRLTPFTGIGYRYLNNDTGGRRSTTGAFGYERESQYLYSPLGAAFDAPLGSNWRLGLSMEYDIFWKGTQKSHLEDVDPDFDMVSNAQTRGYGARGSVKLRRAGELFDLAFGPYVRWWRIQDSKTANVTFSNVIIGTGYEPMNETLEVGGDVNLQF